MAREKEFEQLGCQVVSVACGTQKGGMEWLQKHGYHFLHLLDPDRVFYRQVGLRRFLKNSFCIKTFQRYADEILAGTWKGEEPYSGSDWAVMGGDLLQLASCCMHTSANTSLTDPILKHNLLKVLQGQCMQLVSNFFQVV